VESEIEIIEKFGSKVIAVGLHSRGCTAEEAKDLQASYEKKLGIPVLLPVLEGVDKLIPSLKHIIKSM